MNITFHVKGSTAKAERYDDECSIVTLAERGDESASLRMVVAASNAPDALAIADAIRAAALAYLPAKDEVPA